MPLPLHGNYSCEVGTFSSRVSEALTQCISQGKGMFFDSGFL